MGARWYSLESEERIRPQGSIQKPQQDVAHGTACQESSSAPLGPVGLGDRETRSVSMDTGELTGCKEAISCKGSVNFIATEGPIRGVPNRDKYARTRVDPLESW